MPVYNIQAMADKVRYLETMGLSKEDAEKKAFEELGVAGELPQAVRAEYDRLYQNPTKDSPFARNDRDQLLDRLNAGAKVGGIDTNPRFEQNEADRGQ